MLVTTDRTFTFSLKLDQTQNLAILTSSVLILARPVQTTHPPVFQPKFHEDPRRFHNIFRVTLLFKIIKIVTGAREQPWSIINETKTQAITWPAELFQFFTTSWIVTEDRRSSDRIKYVAGKLGTRTLKYTRLLLLYI